MIETLKKKSLIAWAKTNLWFLLWSKKSEKILKSKLPDAYIVPSAQRCWQAGISSLINLPFLGNITENDIFSIPPKAAGISLYKKRIFSIYKKRKAKILSYLPESKEDTITACKLGADYILTNHLPLEIN